MRQRHSKTLLRTIKARHPQTLCQFPQQIFPNSIAVLPFGRQCGDPLNEHVIEDGTAHFERSCHAHAVNFGEHISGHVAFGVEVQQAADAVGCLTVGIKASNFFKHIASIACCEKVMREQLAFAVRRQKTNGVQITIAPMQ